MRNTVILFLVAIALGAYVYFYEIKGGEERQKEKEQAEKILPFGKDSINYLEISAPGKHFVFQKDQDGWKIEQPVKTDADETPINSLLSSLTGAKKKRTFTPKQGGLDSYGLGKEALVITVKTKSQQARIKLGEATSVGSNVYATTDDSTIAIIASYIKNNADKTLFDWRFKKALHFEKDQVRAFTLRNPKGVFRFEKKGGQWFVEKPVRTRADRSNVDAILNKLEWGRIKSVVAETTDNLNKYGLKKPAYRVELEVGKDKARHGVSFSRVKGATAYGKDDSRPLIFTVEDLYLKPLDKELFDYRSKALQEFNRDQVDSVRWLWQDTLLIAKKDSLRSWRLTSGEKVKSWKITNMLSTLNKTRAKKFVEEPIRIPERYGLHKPQAFIEVYSKGKLLGQLLVGKDAPNNQAYVMTHAGTFIATVDKTPFSRLFPRKRDIVEKEKKAGETDR